MREKTSWRKLVDEVCKDLKQDLVKFTCEDFDREFDDGFGGSEGSRFTAWTRDWVLFPIVYDGAESVGYAPRNPSDKAMQHWGGE